MAANEFWITLERFVVKLTTRAVSFNVCLLRLFERKNASDGVRAYPPSLRTEGAHKVMQMDIRKMIQELHAEREALDRAISSLEELQKSDEGFPLHPSHGRRGRKFMGAKEREEVSARMKRYWASRRSIGVAAPQ